MAPHATIWSPARHIRLLKGVVLVVWQIVATKSPAARHLRSTSELCYDCGLGHGVTKGCLVVHVVEQLLFDPFAATVDSRLNPRGAQQADLRRDAINLAGAQRSSRAAQHLALKAFDIDLGKPHSIERSVRKDIIKSREANRLIRDVGSLKGS